MDESFITQYITDTFAEVELANNFGYTFFFYSTYHTLPFATLILLTALQSLDGVIDIRCRGQCRSAVMLTYKFLAGISCNVNKLFL
jgi:hypothetical protein